MATRQSRSADGLRAALEEAGRSQAWLAKQLVVRPETVSRWVCGELNPTEEHVAMTARLLKTSTTKILAPAHEEGGEP